jgi:hypothetical protein
MRRNRFDPTSSPAHDAVCRQMGKLLLGNDSAITIQHIQGKSNVLADSLSRDSHLSQSHLTQVLEKQTKSSLPRNFEIIEQNPQELLSLLHRLASLLPSKTPTLKEPERSELLRSFSGSFTCEGSATEEASFSMAAATKRKFASAQPFATRIEMETWETSSGIQKSVLEQSETPSHKWERHAACMVEPRLF